MKRLKQMLLLTMLAVFTMSIAVPVYAKTEVMTETRAETLYPAKDKNCLGNGKNVIILGMCDGKSPYTNVEVKNKAVVRTIMSKRVNGHSFLKKAFVLELKKPGRTAISYKEKVGDETIIRKIDLRIKKYVNPIASIKLGNQTIKGSKFNNTSVYKVKYSDFKNRKIQVKITPAKGWSLSKNAYLEKGEKLNKKAQQAYDKGDDDKAYEIWNKADAFVGKPSFAYLPAKLSFSSMWGHLGTPRLNSKNGSSVKVNGGKGSEIMITLINNKTKQEETIEIRFQ